MKLSFWDQEWEVGGPYLADDLRDSNDIVDDGAALRARIEEDGYLLVRGLRDRETVLGARRQILESLSAKGAVLPGTALMEGIINPAAGGPATTSVRANEALRPLPAVQHLFRMPAVMGFFERLLGGPAATFDFQWLRVARRGAQSAIHSDAPFMGRGTQRLYSCWTPLGDISLDMGPIVLALGTQRVECLKETYWKADVDRDLIEGWLSKSPLEIVEKFGGRWSTTTFQAGDVLVFGLHILHASLANTSDRYRISVDTRYQLASEPFDERWVGPKPIMHYNFWKPDVQLEPVGVSRARWGI